MSKYDDCLYELLDEAFDKGYLTFDDIMDTTDAYDLSLANVDKLSENILLRGIIIYEDEPKEQKGKKLEDHSQIDYERIYKEIVKISPQLEYIVNIVKDLPTPQNKEITLLTTQNKKGNEYARERLILLHLRIVLKIALATSKRFEYDIVDAVSSGMIGLIIAVEKFNPKGFTAFQSYASICIQTRILRDCEPIGFVFYFPAHFKERMIKVKEKFESENGSIDDALSEDDINSFAQEMSLELKIKEEQIIQCLHQLKNQKCHLVLNENVDLGNEEKCIYDIQNKRDNTPEKLFSDKLLKKEIDTALLGLTEREEKVLRLRFGLDDGRVRCLEEVGCEFNVTRERIRQIEVKALRKLKHPTRSKNLKDFLKG